MEPEAAGDEGREPRRGDRRRRATPPLSRYSFWGGRRRRPGRRPGDATQAFVDVYPLRHWILLTTFVVLNLLDAHFTLLYLQRGGEEANPVAVRLLLHGMESFIAVKAVGIGIGACVFCVLAHFRNAQIGVLITLCFYQLLLVYHLALYFNWIGNVFS